MPGRWSVVGVTVIGGMWSVGGGFVLRRNCPGDFHSRSVVSMLQML